MSPRFSPPGGEGMRARTTKLRPARFAAASSRRERLPKERMIRFVVGPDRVLVPDLAATLPGRGMWLSASGDVIQAARAQGGLGRAFARAARGPVTVSPDLPAVLEAALVRRIGELLGLARRAGQAVAGFDKAREWLRSGRGRLILQASDGSVAERARFLAGAVGIQLFTVAGSPSGCGAWSSVRA